MTVRPLLADVDRWLPLRRALWPDGPDAIHDGEAARYRDDDAAVQLAETDGVTVGLAERTERPRDRGLRETASDAALDNAGAIAAHATLGLHETLAAPSVGGRVVQFLRRIP